MKIIAQIYTGGYEGPYLKFDTFLNKIENLNFEDLDGIIIGWSKNIEENKKIFQYLNEQYSIPVYIWMPLFSEMDLIGEVDPLVDYKGVVTQSYPLKEGESFNFYCPTSRKNIELFKSVYENYYSSLPHAGVFLDKIRYPSFANGGNSLWTCFCDQCREEMKREGLNVDLIINEIETLEGNEKLYRKFIRHLYNRDLKEFPHLEVFLRWRNLNIYRSLLELVEYFSEKNIQVSIDTFEATFSHFFGQDLSLMSACVDFIKPMFYQTVTAPAGIPFEINKIFEKGSQKNKQAIIDQVIQYKQFKNMEIHSKVYAGIEIMSIKNISKANPKNIQANIDKLWNDVDGFVLSWDVLSAPQENYHFSVNYIRNRGR